MLASAEQCLLYDAHFATTDDLRMPALLLTRCCFVIVLLATAWRPALADTTPLEVLRANIAKGIAVLQDPTLREPSQANAQRDRLCAVGREVFDPYLFAKVTLGANWQHFDAQEQQTFVEVFGDYICRNFISRLQQRYRDEQIEFVDEQFHSETRATVSAMVLWQDSRIPIKVRMALRDGAWRAYDLVLFGVSAVKVYRTQVQESLVHDTPAQLIQHMREKTARNDGMLTDPEAETDTQ